jgi:hypothetical protein
MSCVINHNFFNQLTHVQESWLAKHAVSEEDRVGAEEGKSDGANAAPDPMQGLEGLDVAGPKPE